MPPEENVSLVPVNGSPVTHAEETAVRQTNRPTRRTVIAAGAFLSLFFIALLVIVILSLTGKFSNRSTILAVCPSPVQHRLPTHTSPTHYDLHLLPDIDRRTLTADVFVNITTLTLNVHQLHIDSVAVHSDTREVYVSHFIVCNDHDDESQQMVVSTSELVPGEYVLSVKYSSRLYANLIGLYVNSVPFPDGTIKDSLITQLEPTEARRVLPCWDEPAFKANFTVHIQRRNEHISLSNMPVASTVDVPGRPEWKIDHFEPSVRMSTYLLAVGVGDFKSRSMMHDDVKVSVYAPPHQIHHVDFGLDFAVKTLDFFEKYFNIHYPLPKLDMIAVADFNSGAMENWGLVTYRENFMLVNESRINVMVKEGVASVIAHELAHQWYGNLVTMVWWDEIWLNEAFATFMEYYALDSVVPDWKFMNKFYVENQLTSMHFDAMSSSHAIYNPVETPSDIGGIFNSITYQKGACFVRMMASLLGEKAFRTAVHNYLTSNAYSNALSSDLWHHFNQELPPSRLPEHTDLNSVANAWTHQTGYPYITAHLSSDQHSITFKQVGRYMYNDDLIGEQQYWPIPVSYRTSETIIEEQPVWLTDGLPVTVTLSSPAEWFTVNVNGTGFFRVVYDDADLERFAEMLKNASTFEILSDLDRASLVHDLMSHMQKGIVSASSAFNVFDYLRLVDERAGSVWQIVAKSFAGIEYLMRGTDGHEAFKNYARACLTGIYNHVGWHEHGDEHRMRSLQGQILPLACQLNVGDCVLQARHRFAKWKLNKLDLPPPDTLSTMLSTGVSHGNSDDWHAVRDAFLDQPFDKVIYLEALSKTTNVTLLKRLLADSFNSSFVAQSVAPQILAVVAENEAGASIAWEFMKSQWHNKFAQQKTVGLLGQFVQGVIGHFSTQKAHDEAQAFLAGKDVGVNELKVEQILESVRVNIRWRQANEVTLQEWLATKTFEIPPNM